MKKRTLATALWFLAGWSGGALLVGLMGLPSILGFAPGIALGALVRLDPGGFLWKHQATGPRVVPISDHRAGLAWRRRRWPAATAETRRI
jgi:hypothetical protein